MIDRISEGEGDDTLERCNREIARQRVDRIPEDLRDDAGALTILERNYHLGVDSEGKRLSSLERAVVGRTKDALRQQMADKYAGGDLMGLDETLSNQNIGNRYIKEELVRRAERRHR